MGKEKEIMDISEDNLVKMEKELTWKVVWFYTRNLAIILLVCWLMFSNLHNSENNIVAMLFFGIIGISAVIEIGLADKLLKATKEILNKT